MTKKQDFTFESKDGKNTVHAIAWYPADKEPVGVVQLIHGMTEYIDRYDEFARFLNEHGMVVVGHDHLGHGKTVAGEADYGYFHETAGNAMLLRDIHRLREMTAAKYPDVPYFILGHSMGSFLLRQYLCMHGEGLAGAVVMGTGTQPMAILKLGKAVCCLQAKLFGWRHRSNLVYGMAFGSYLKKIEPIRTRYDWLTKDEIIVNKYAQDPLCTFKFTLNGYYNLFYSMEQAARKENLKKMPKTLPVLFVAGKEDPVGAYGEGVRSVCRSFEALEMKDVECIIYEDDRHEILNETDRRKVYEDIHTWIRVKMLG